MRGIERSGASLGGNRALALEIIAQTLAHTLPERNASARILERAGLPFAGEVHDPKDGRVWRWVLPRR